MPVFSQLMFHAVHWAARAARRGNFFQRCEEAGSATHGHSRGNLRLLVSASGGVRFVARNYTPRGTKGEIDLVGYDGKALAFVEVRTRTAREDLTALPELSVTKWSFALRSGFWQNATLTNVPAGLTLWPLITARASRRWSVCTRTPSAPQR